ncbi:MAG: DUF5106 domain-containing protein [Bacteroidales bacterium]|nr:DUF5106 domain-containing protein [Bacteroidales bacterium]NLK82116.1 DUF5106 domain-containing protein [Bacteroidales bacterium]HPY81916.1 DUF5106 domain-containing protein [Bacteroidales bacterium]
MKKLLLFTAFFGITVGGFAQKGHKIDVQVKGLKDTTLILGHHYGNKKLVADTIRVDAKGKGVFQGDTALPSGMYLVLTPDMRFFEIIVDKEQHFKVTTDTADLFQNLKIEGSSENTVFNDYQKISSDFYIKRKPLFDKLRYYYGIEDTTKFSAKERKKQRDSITIIRAELEEIRTQQLAYEDNIISKYPKSFLTSILNTMRELDVPDFPRDEHGTITDSLFQYNYMRTHFFDRVNFADERLLRSPVYEMKINQFFDKELVQIPDSIIPEVDKLLTRIIVEEKKGYEGKMYYYTLHTLFMKYQNPKYMGFDNIFVYLMEQYYISHKIPERIINDSAYMAQITDRYQKMSRNRIGALAPDLLLYSNQNQWVQLNSIEADFVVIYFYDIDCGHCKKILPEWNNLYTKNKLQDKKVVSIYIYTQTDMEKWKEYIVERGIDKTGIHLFDPYQNTNFRTYYDIYSTPVAYVLDSQKKIIAKRLPPETILEVIQHEIKKKQ